MSLKKTNIGIWLINLPDDTSRRQKMEFQLKELGLEANIFKAIDGKKYENELSIKACPKAYARNMGSNLLPGKLGVYASHISVWEALLESSHEAALVLEDDVVFHNDFTLALEIALENADLWDLVKLSKIRAKFPIKQAELGPYTLNAYIGPFTGNACYLIHKSVAKHILRGLWPQTRALDHELNRFFVHNYRQLGLEPWASHPDDHGISTITGMNFSFVKKFKWYKRLPYYCLKAANYFRRAFWLWKNDMLWPNVNKRNGKETGCL